MSREKRTKFDEIDVGRMNIVDEDGTIRMALSNKEHFPAPLVINGKPVQREGLPRAGAIFYNDEGIECGGLVFASEKDNKGYVTQQASLTFDPYLQNEVFGMGMVERDGKREVRLELNDQPDFPITDVAKKLVELENAPKEEKETYIKELKENDALGHNRIQVVKSRDGEAEIKLSDSKGNPRIRLVVDADDVPKFEILDQEGEVVYSFPQK